MSADILEAVEKQSRYAFPQILTYLRFREKTFAAEIEIFKTPARAAILRAIGERELAYADGTNAASISDTIPVPRETVRRHLLWLESRGYVVREGNNYRIGPEILGPVVERVDDHITELLKTAEQIRNFKPNAL
jgi:DNA-binding transcriptional ArsR family regulator